jgi:hypothetical protein
MLDQDTWETDFLTARPNQPGDLEAVQKREAANVVTSYLRASDFLAEALQNAADAIDMRSAEEEGAPRRILITFDRSQRRFSVADTGVGMSRSDLEVVLTPNVTLKAGRMARSTTGRSRGHKGVGLSFLALGSNFLQIQTCDREHRYDVVVTNGHRWLESTEESFPKPVARGSRNRADRHLDSDRYTIVTVGDINSADFDLDLFDLEVGELEWLLRTKTAVGNTAPLWREPFNAPLPPGEDVDVSLVYTDAHGATLRPRPVPYRYATPEEYVPAERVVDYDELSKMDATDVEERLKDGAFRYRSEFTSKSGRGLSLYLFSMAAAEVELFAERARADVKKHGYAPDEWQGFWVATRDMPVDIKFDPTHVQPRTWERRIFALLQDDGLTLDLGRKTLVGRTVRMYRDAVKAAWADVARYVAQVSATKTGAQASDAILRSEVEQAKRLDDLAVNELPYLKEPTRWVGVLSLFHEMLGQGGALPSLRTLRDGVFTDDRDALLYIGSPNGAMPLHVVYGHTMNDIFSTLGRLEGSDTVGLAVVWELDERALLKRGVDAVEVNNLPSGATHVLSMHRQFDLETLPVIALKTVVERLS